MAVAQSRLTQTIDYQNRLGEELRRAEAHLKDLRYDECLWECIPDDAPPRTEYVDLEELEASLAGAGEDGVAEGINPAVRDWLTTKELAAVRGIRARSTVARWLLGECLPARAEDRPWEPDAIPLDNTLGINYGRIWAPGVKASFWRTKLIETRLAACLAKWPQEQGWLDGDGPGPRCLAPLDLARDVKRFDDVSIATDDPPRSPAQAQQPTRA